MTALELDGVTVRFGDVTAVDDVTLSVDPGELLVLVGPSGCGKTTLLRTIAGLEPPDAGDVSLDGRRVTDLPARKRDVSLVFQDFALFPHLSARENVAFDLQMQGEANVDERVDEVAALLDIEGLLERSIDELSGGQKQRVALGRAIVTEPSAFLLDEPLANLDANLRERMQTEIARLQDRLAITTVHVTHDQAEALTMGDRIAVMCDGRLEQVGTPEAIYHDPASLFVARFIGNPTMNLIDGRVDADAGVFVRQTATGDWSIPVGPLDGGSTDAVLGVRPEALDVTPDVGTGSGRLAGAVVYDEFRGADRFLYLDVDGFPELVARVDSGGPESGNSGGVSTGESVSVAFPDDTLLLFDAESGERLPTGSAAVRDTRQATGGDRQ